MHFLRYEQAPASVAEEVIAKRAGARRWRSRRSFEWCLAVESLTDEELSYGQGKI